MSKIIKQKNKGFTLLEALVAISILMVAVAAPITIAQKGLSSAVFSKDQMIASYLAQDAIEFIKNRRDVATINNENFDWANFLNEFEGCLGQDLISGDECQIDTIAEDDNISSYGQSGDFLIKDTNGFYQYENAGKETKFKRKIFMVRNKIQDEDDEILITVTVSWGTSDDTRLEVKTLIYNY